LGYKLKVFNHIAEKIDGIQPGFYIVAGETNVGKTAFLTNLFLDILESNPETSGIYFSLDDTKDIIIDRFLGIKTSLPLNEVKRKQSDPERRNRLDKEYEQLISWAKDERIDIKDVSEIDGIEELQKEIKERPEELFVVIDGLYNLEMGGRFDSIREENIQRANNIKTLVDTYSIPIICTGELRKRDQQIKRDQPRTIDDLMETGKFAYNANLVLLLYPEKYRDYNTSDEPYLILEFAKNKLSAIRDKVQLKFIRTTGKILEGRAS